MLWPGVDDPHLCSPPLLATSACRSSPQPNPASLLRRLLPQPPPRAAPRAWLQVASKYDFTGIGHASIQGYKGAAQMSQAVFGGR